MFPKFRVYVEFDSESEAESFRAFLEMRRKVDVDPKSKNYIGLNYPAWRIVEERE